MAAPMKLTSSFAAPHRLQRASRGCVVAVRVAQQVDTNVAVNVVQQGAFTMRYGYEHSTRSIYRCKAAIERL